MSGRGWWMIVVLAGGWSCIGLPPSPPAGMGAGSTSAGSSTGGAGNDTRLETSEGSMTGGVTTTSTTGSADDSTGSSGSSTGKGVEQEVLERANFGDCAQPLWCYSPDIETPVGAPLWLQECFTASTEPPFELVEVQAVIRGLGGEIADVTLEVHGQTQDGPGALLASRSLDAASMVIGINTFTLDPPLSLDQQEICIGFAAPEPEPARALGVSVDPASAEMATSYLRIEGEGGCLIPDWSDVMELGTMPSGNWCIQATIQSL